MSGARIRSILSERGGLQKNVRLAVQRVFEPEWFVSGSLDRLPNLGCDVHGSLTASNLTSTPTTGQNSRIGGMVRGFEHLALTTDTIVKGAEVWAIL